MMYIRTKDGVYEIDEEINYDGEMFYYIKSKPPRKAFEECEILKQTENLEDLCDEFVIIPRNDWAKNYLAYGVNTKFLKESIYNLNYPIKEVYGAIWTDKGLIYVAKMNDAGELELI